MELTSISWRSSEHRPIRWGIVGTGEIAQLFALGLRDLPGAEIVAVSSRNKSRADWFSQQFGVTTAYADYDELLADKSVDVVYIATPNYRHKEDAIAALNADKPVLCEKPFAASALEAQEVASLARERGVFCMEALWTHFLPLMNELSTQLETIGPIRMLTAQLGHALHYDPSKSLFASPGGGATLDLGVYLISIALRYLGTPDSIAAKISKFDNGVDSQMTAILTFPGQTLATLSVSLVSNLKHHADFLGTKGSVRVNAPVYRPDTLTVERFEPARPGGDISPRGLIASLRSSSVARTAYRKISQQIPALSRGPDRLISKSFRGNGYGYQAAEVMRCLRQGETESSILPLSHTLAVMQVIDQIRATED